MSRWLAVAEGLFRGRVNAPPPPFEIVCGCGRTIAGQRTKAAQTQTCPACGLRLFVLPACVYPLPRTPKSKAVVVPPRTKPDDDTDDARDAAALPPKSKPATSKPATGAHAAPAGKLRPNADAGKKPGTIAPKPDALPTATLRSVASRVDLERLRRKLLSPVRVVLASVALVVGLTFWWMWHLQALNQAERTVVSAGKQAEQALEESDLGEAARQYQQVRRALDALGRNDSRAKALRQTAAEISAGADLASASLFDILHEAAARTTSADRESWAESFQSNYRDEWVVVDARVSRLADSANADPTDGRRFDIDFHLGDGPNQAVIVADLPVFDQAISPGGEPARVIFAAQLDECSPDPNREHTWRIVLRPATGFLWSSVPHLELLGLSADAETIQLLAAQTVHLGIGQ